MVAEKASLKIKLYVRYKIFQITLFLLGSSILINHYIDAGQFHIVKYRLYRNKRVILAMKRVPLCVIFCYRTLIYILLNNLVLSPTGYRSQTDSGQEVILSQFISCCMIGYVELSEEKFAKKYLC